MNLFFSITTLILSLIAIVISIYTVQKQNKLHLFEKRYDVFHKLSFLIAVAQSAVNNKDTSEREFLRSCKDAYIEVVYDKRYSDNSDLKAFYHNLCLSAIRIEFLFPKKHAIVCCEFLQAFRKYLYEATDSKDTEATKKELSYLLDKLDTDKTVKSLEGYLNIG